MKLLPRTAIFTCIFVFAWVGSAIGTLNLTAEPEQLLSNMHRQRLRFILPPLPDRDIEFFSGDGRPGQRKGAGSRDDCPFKPADQYLTALVPLSQAIDLSDEKAPFVLGLTSAERPVFWFYIPYDASPPREVRFVLRNTHGNTLYQNNWQFARIPGIVSIQLPDDVKLEIGQRYRWLFVFTCDPKNPSSDDVVKGWVKRVALSSKLSRELDAARTVRERIFLYAANGLWHDALNKLAEHRNDPHYDSFVADWSSVLQSIGLETIGSELFVIHNNSRYLHSP